MCEPDYTSYTQIVLTDNEIGPIIKERVLVFKKDSDYPIKRKFDIKGLQKDSEVQYSTSELKKIS